MNSRLIFNHIGVKVCNEGFLAVEVNVNVLLLVLYTVLSIESQTLRLSRYMASYLCTILPGLPKDFERAMYLFVNSGCQSLSELTDCLLNIFCTFGWNKLEARQLFDINSSLFFFWILYHLWYSIQLLRLILSHGL